MGMSHARVSLRFLEAGGCAGRGHQSWEGNQGPWQELLSFLFLLGSLSTYCSAPRVSCTFFFPFE